MKHARAGNVRSCAFPAARLAVPLATLVLLLSAPAGRLAAQQSITSDRPGIGSGSSVLERGVIQVETGLEYAGLEADALDIRTLAVGQLVVRVGVPRVEVELFANSWVRTTSRDSDQSESGVQDLAVGVKLPVTRGLGERADISFQGIVTTPSGADAFSDDAWGLDMIALADVTLTERAAVSVNLGWHPPHDTPGTVALIVTPALSLGGGYGAYAGWAATFYSELEDEHFLEGGLTYLPGSELQLDVNGGFDVAQKAWFVGAGIALRWGAG